MAEFNRGDLVWFDPGNNNDSCDIVDIDNDDNDDDDDLAGIGYVLPGEVLEFHQQAQVYIMILDRRRMNVNE